MLLSSAALDLVADVTDSNGAQDVFLFERGTGTVTLVSRSAAAATTSANNFSLPTAISADGQIVLFKSFATDLGAGVTDTNSNIDAFLYERQTGAVTLVSRSGASATTTANAATEPTGLSADGEWVLFHSAATNIVTGLSDNNAAPDAFLFQRSTGEVTVISRSANSATTTANGFAFPVLISADGERMLLECSSTDLIAAVSDVNEASDVFLYQRSNDKLTLVSRSANSATTTANGLSLPAAISADGNWVSFRSEATDLVPGLVDGNASDDAFLAEYSDVLFRDGFENL